MKLHFRPNKWIKAWNFPMVPFFWWVRGTRHPHLVPIQLHQITIRCFCQVLKLPDTKRVNIFTERTRAPEAGGTSWADEGSLCWASWPLMGVCWWEPGMVGGSSQSPLSSQQHWAGSAPCWSNVCPCSWLGWWWSPWNSRGLTDWSLEVQELTTCKLTPFNFSPCWQKNVNALPNLYEDWLPGDSSATGRGLLVPCRPLHTEAATVTQQWSRVCWMQESFTPSLSCWSTYVVQGWGQACRGQPQSITEHQIC